MRRKKWRKKQGNVFLYVVGGQSLKELIVFLSYITTLLFCLLAQDESDECRASKVPVDNTVVLSNPHTHQHELKTHTVGKHFTERLRIRKLKM